MAGQLKVGGNIIASHSGVEGAGTVTLQNATLDSGVTFPAGHVVGFFSKDVTGVTESVYTGIAYNDDITTSNSTLLNSLTYTLKTNNPKIKVEFGGTVGFQTYGTGTPIFVLSLFNGSTFKTSMRDVLENNGYVKMYSYPLSFVESLTQDAGTNITINIRASLSSNFSNNTGITNPPLVGLGTSGYDNNQTHPVFLTITEIST